jgi:hypothetical protein
MICQACVCGRGSLDLCSIEFGVNGAIWGFLRMIRSVSNVLLFGLRQLVVIREDCDLDRRDR